MANGFSLIRYIRASCPGYIISTVMISCTNRILLVLVQSNRSGLSWYLNATVNKLQVPIYQNSACGLDEGRKFPDYIVVAPGYLTQY